MPVNAVQVKKKILVGLTGRSHSLVAAYLLKKQGHEVLGLTIDFKDEELVKLGVNPRCYVTSIEQVRVQCEQLSIPFFVTNAKLEFEDVVLEHVVAKRLMAQSISSCFYCHQLILKILLRKMVSLKADGIATGHFAKVYLNHQTEKFHAHSSNDKNYDQSMLMAGLSQDVLEKLYLPLSELNQTEVLALAEQLPVTATPPHTKRGMCFSREDSTSNMIDKKVAPSFLRPGTIIDLISELNCGEHQGTYRHEVGEKAPVKSGNLEHYRIVEIRPVINTIYIQDEVQTVHRGCQLYFDQDVSHIDESLPLEAYARFELNGPLVFTKVFFKSANTAYLEMAEDVPLLSRDQLVVLYQSNTIASKILVYGFISHKDVFTLQSRTDEFSSAANPANPNDGQKNEKNPFQF